MALRHFGGVYFSYRQAAELDVILEYAHSSGPAVRSMLIAATLSTASDLVNTVGKHFAQPLRPRNKNGTIKPSLYNQASRDRCKSVLEVFVDKLARYLTLRDVNYENRAVRCDYMEFLTSSGFNCGVVYADPPYTRDHYSRFYHVLETLALRDDPDISTNTAHGKTVLSRGIYRQDRHQSPFCIRSEAPAAFDELFGTVAKRGIPLVLSYSPYASEKNAHPRVMTMEGVTELARQHFRSVDFSSVGSFFHSRLNRSDLNKDISYEAEYLLTCRP
jgi:adenine-specific DNA methylase